MPHEFTTLKHAKPRELRIHTKVSTSFLPPYCRAEHKNKWRGRGTEAANGDADGVDAVEVEGADAGTGTEIAIEGEDAADREPACRDAGRASWAGGRRRRAGRAGLADW